MFQSTFVALIWCTQIVLTPSGQAYRLHLVLGQGHFSRSPVRCVIIVTFDFYSSFLRDCVRVYFCAVFISRFYFLLFYYYPIYFNFYFYWSSPLIIIASFPSLHVLSSRLLCPDLLFSFTCILLCWCRSCPKTALTLCPSLRWGRWPQRQVSHILHLISVLRNFSNKVTNIPKKEIVIYFNYLNVYLQLMYSQKKIRAQIREERSNTASGNRFGCPIQMAL